MVSRLVFFVVLLLACGNCLTATAQDKVRIRSVSAQTEDLVTFRISTSQSRFALHEDIPINYTVTNNSRKVVYLVLEPKPQLKVDEKQRTVTIKSPVKYQDEFLQYDNDLIRILPRRSFSGKLVIKAAEVPRDQESESEDWDLRVVFSYVFDPPKAVITELLGCKDAGSSFYCLGKLLDVARSLTVGDLRVEVRSR